MSITNLIQGKAKIKVVMIYKWYLCTGKYKCRCVSVE